MKSRIFYLSKQGSLAAKMMTYLGIVVAACGLTNIGLAEDITIRLPHNVTVSRKIVEYRCDAQGVKIGLPSGSFSAEYIDGGGNSLVVVPIAGNPLVFSNVMSGSGARYAAREFIWWEAKGAVTIYSDSLNGKSQSTCNPIKSK